MSQAVYPVAEEDALILFDQLEPGTCLGSTAMSVDRRMLQAWQALYGPRTESPVLPLAFAPLLLMRAMLAIVSPRPPGNIHVGQTYRIRRMPRIDAALTASVWCSEKDVRKGRRVVKLEIVLTELPGADPIVSGCSTLFWAR
jgi:hypothetical protein